jgi:hypothetical protein
LSVTLSITKQYICLWHETSFRCEDSVRNTELTNCLYEAAYILSFLVSATWLLHHIRAHFGANPSSPDFSTSLFVTFILAARADGPPRLVSLFFQALSFELSSFNYFRRVNVFFSPKTSKKGTKEKKKKRTRNTSS